MVSFACNELSVNWSQGSMENNKELFNEQVFEYADTVFTTFFENILFILPSALVWSAAAFLIVIVTLIVLTKKRFFKRLNKVWNYAAKIHYPVWITVFVIVGFINGAMNSAGSRAENILESTGKPIIEASVLVLYEQLLEEFSISPPNEKISIQSITTNIINDMAAQENPEPETKGVKAKVKNWLRYQLTEWIVTSAVNEILSSAVQKTTSALNISEEYLEFDKEWLVNMDFSKTGDVISEVVYKTIERNLKIVISGFKSNMYILFVLAILLLLIEPAVYYYWRKQYSNKNQQDAI